MVLLLPPVHCGKVWGVTILFDSRAFFPIKTLLTYLNIYKQVPNGFPSPLVAFVGLLWPLKHLKRHYQLFLQKLATSISHTATSIFQLLKTFADSAENLQKGPPKKFQGASNLKIFIIYGQQLGQNPLCSALCSVDRVSEHPTLKSQLSVYLSIRDAFKKKICTKWDIVLFAFYPLPPYGKQDMIRRGKSKVNSQLLIIILIRTFQSKKHNFRIFIFFLSLVM